VLLRPLRNRRTPLIRSATVGEEGAISTSNAEQARAIDAVTGPVLIHAGPGTGKTRVVTHRIAEQVRRGVAPAPSVMAVTFTEKAAGELLARLRGLGVPAGGRGGVRASTFHSAALRQVRWFWPRVRQDAAPLEVLPSKLAILGPMLRGTGTGVRRIAPGDLAAEVEWVKAQGVRGATQAMPGEVRADSPGEDPTVLTQQPLGVIDLDGPAPRWRIDPDAYLAALERHDGPWDREMDRAAIAESFVALVDRYEETKAAAGRLDFEDLLAVASRLVGQVPEVGDAVRGRYTHFTVDEFQDVNRLQWDLLLAWLGGRDEVCVVGDGDQAIYGFSGASATYLETYRRRFPHVEVVELRTNYRSTQPILDTAAAALAGRSARPLRATRPGARPPTLVQHADDAAERAWVVDRCRRLQRAGVEWQEMAVLYRFNAQSERWEEAFAEAGIPYTVRDDPGFFGRRHVERALTVLRAAARAGEGEAMADDPLVVLDGAEPSVPPLDRVVARVLRQRMSWTEREPEGETARERWEDLSVLVELAKELVAADDEATLADYLDDLDRRADLGRAPDGGGVNLMTLHRAKGLEFDAVFLVSVEEGRVPSRYAIDHDERHGLRLGAVRSQVTEERRLLYVGLTRAREHLHVSWAERGSKRRSRFLRPISGRAVEGGDGSRGDGSGRGRGPGGGARTAGNGDVPLSEQEALVFESLREWRLRRALDDGVPPYVVFHDRTLRDIARRGPRDRDDLSRISGVGATKLERYADDVLTLLGGAE
jgi:DNA helicase II / ATP-dependent DNA helicase PcrA